MPKTFDRHARVPVSFFLAPLIHHFPAITDNDLESSFLAAKFALGLPELSGDCLSSRDCSGCSTSAA